MRASEGVIECWRVEGVIECGPADGLSAGGGGEGELNSGYWEE